MRERLRAQSEAVTGLRVKEESLKARLQDEVASHTEIQHRYVYMNCLNVMAYVLCQNMLLVVRWANVICSPCTCQPGTL